MALVWDQAAVEWHQFLVAIEGHIRDIRAVNGTPWFRGQPADFDLLPTLFRPTKPYVADLHLRRARAQLVSELTGIRLQMKELAASLASPHLTMLEGQKTQLWEDLKKRSKASSAGPELASLRTKIQDVRDEIAKHSGSRKNDPDLLKLKEELRETQVRLKANANAQTVHRTSARKPRVVGRVAEIRAFHGFSRVHSLAQESSWTILGEMRHSGVKTRLLDWTENLSVACFFAVSAFRDRLRRCRNADPDFDVRLSKAKSKNDLKKALRFDKASSQPVVYVLDAHSLAFHSRSLERIPLISLEKDLDYYESFVLRNHWPCRTPLPVAIPWTTPRQSSQSGCYTVFNDSPIAMQRDEQITKTILQSEKLSWMGAVYGAKLFEIFQRMDDFTVMQDITTFGERVNSEAGL